MVEKEKRTLEEVLHKEVYKVGDIEVIFQVKKAQAYKIIRQVKSVSDRLNISGMIHRKDYEDYINRDLSKKVG